MARCHLEDLTTRHPTLIYIAGHLWEATRVEQVLQNSGVDYALNLEPFVAASMLGGVYPGLFVYVPAQDAEFCRTHLMRCGLTDIVMQEDPQKEEGGEEDAS
ncbi:MAG: hypothetical protein D6704_08750 [Nitrospirae bacterium]|nr:MAG: hypothetical protein D6704_08750 [Nitrospirota bacterium]